MEQYIVEGGASGHLMHLYDNRELTFGELKDVLHSAAEGHLEKVTEKLDGMNLVFTYAGSLKVARSGGDIKGGGLDAGALAQKFQGRGNVAEAFNGAFKVLHDALGSLPDEVRQQVFADGERWYSIEVIYSQNPNVINYDSNWIVFHASPVFRLEGDRVVKEDDAPGVDVLERHIDRMQKAVTLRSWQVRGPAVLRLRKISDGAVVTQALNAIDQAQAAGACSDNDTLDTYLHNRMVEEVADLALPPEVAQAVVARCVGDPGAPGLPQIKKMVPADVYPSINQFVKASPAVMKRLIEPIELAIHSFAIEVLRGLHSTLIGNSDEEVARLRQTVAHAVKAIESSGNVQAMDILAREMRKLGSVENIASAMEGIVFRYRGNTYKFTASFAPANQILGLFRYGRAGKI